MKNHSRLSVPRILTPIALAITLAACSSSQLGTQHIDITQMPTENAQRYLQKADSSEGRVQNDWLIMALKAAVNQNDAAQANLLLFKLSKQRLNESQQAEWQLARAKLLLNRNQNETAEQQLDFKPWWKLSNSQWLEYYQTKVEIYTRLNRKFDLVKSLTDVYSYCGDSQKGDIAEQIWLALDQFSESEITGLSVNPNDEELSGWVQLSVYMKTLGGNLDQLQNTLKNWLKENPDHPAAIHMPKPINAILSMKVTRPMRTALLLPLTGKFAQQAQLIRDGFMFAMMNDDRRKAKEGLQVIDSNGQSMAALANQIHQKKIDFIVGPLVKNNVEKLAAIKQKNGYSGQMLALNIPDKISHSTNTCYFALSPEQEAEQAAKHLFRLGYQYPLVFAPEGEYGKRVIDAFNKEWAKYSKHPVVSSYLGNKNKIQKKINGIFDLQESQQNIAGMQSMLGVRLKSQPRSRRDIDAIYVVANSSELTLIKPFIEVAVNPDAKQPKLFSSSRSNNGKTQYEDLSRVAFSDIPLLLQPKASIKAQMDALWPNEPNAEIRLKAMGMDAYKLITELPQMKASRGYHVKGQTGELSIDDKCVVQHELSWGEHASL